MLSTPSETHAEVLLLLHRAYQYTTVPSTVVLLAAGLLIWRFLKFTVIPALYPDDPKELPYWIPCKISM